MFILVMVLFSGQTYTQQFNSLQECNAALYNKIDEVFIKNINSIECKKSPTKFYEVLDIR